MLWHLQRPLDAADESKRPLGTIPWREDPYAVKSEIRIYFLASLCLGKTDTNTFF